MAKKKSGLGKAGDELDLVKPMGIAQEVEPPPPPPPETLEADGEAETPMQDERLEAPPEFFQEAFPPEEAPPPPAAAPQPQPPARREVDLQLLPWVIKKAIALETQRDELDYTVVLCVEGKRERLILEGHRNCFGRVSAKGPGQSLAERLAWGASEFSSLSAEEAIVRYLDHFTDILVESEDFEIIFDNFDDLLEWCEY